MWTKFERAKEHLAQLHAEHTAFAESEPYTVEPRKNPATGNFDYCVAEVRNVPESLSTTTGDVLQCLRSALDHLAYRLWRVGPEKESPTEDGRHIYFPIFDSRTDYEAKACRKVLGLSHDAISAIDELMPYRGGNDSLWKLHQLNIIDKHRSVILVASVLRSVDLVSIVRKQASNLDPWFGSLLGSSSGFFKASDTCPLRPGAILLENVPEDLVPRQMGFRFQLAFAEPGVIDGDSLVESLDGMVCAVEQAITRLSHFLP